MGRLMRRGLHRGLREIAVARLRWRGVTLGQGAVVTGYPELLRGGAPVTIGAGSHLRSGRDEAPQVSTGNIRLIAQSGSGIHIGRHTAINRGVCLISRAGIRIGDGVIIAPNVIFLDYDGHSVDPEKRLYAERDVVRLGFFDHEAPCAEIVVGDNVWIGLGAVVLKGVHIGDHSVIGAGAVVRSNVPERVLVAGNPATVVRSL